MQPYLVQAAVFLIDLIFGLYMMIVLLRYLLARIRADFYNPLSQFILKITSPPLKPLRRFIPGYFGIDWSLISLLFLLQGLEICLITLVTKAQLPALIGLLLLIISHLLQMIIYLYIFILIVQVIISWVNPQVHNAITVIMHQLSTPLLRPVRQLIPSIGGFDWSVFIAFIGLQLILILLVQPLMDVGYRLSF